MLGGAAMALTVVRREQGQRGQRDGLMGGLMASWGEIEVVEGNQTDESGQKGTLYRKKKIVTTSSTCVVKESLSHLKLALSP